MHSEPSGSVPDREKAICHVRLEDWGAHGHSWSPVSPVRNKRSFSHLPNPMCDRAEDGRPNWLPNPDGAGWFRFGATAGALGRLRASFEERRAVPRDLRTSWQPPVGFITQLPQLDLDELGSHAVPHHGFGRPPLLQEEQCVHAAYLADIAGLGYGRVARVLFDGEPLTRAMKDKARRRIQAGQRLQHDRGRLPWVAFPPGDLVPSDWWTHEDFWLCIRWWADAPARECVKLAADVQRGLAMARDFAGAQEALRRMSPDELAGRLGRVAGALTGAHTGARQP